MTIYVVLESYDYEGFKVRGLFSERQKADDWLMAKPAIDRWCFIVEEWELDTPESE